MSDWSFAFSSTICILVRSSSASGTAVGCSSIRSVIGIAWHISNAPTKTSTWRWWGTS